MRFPAIACLLSFTTFRISSRNACTLFREGVISNFPLYLRRCCPRKSKPSSICVMRVFSLESSSPRSLMNCSTRGFTSCSSISFDLPVMMKSSAKRTKLTFSLLLPRGDLGNFSRSFLSNPSNVRLASTGEQIPPWGVPSSVAWRTSLSMNPALSHFLSMVFSIGMCARSHSCEILSKHDFMSPSSIHCAEFFRLRSVKHCSIASAGDRADRNP